MVLGISTTVCSDTGHGGTYSGMIYLAGSHPSLTLSNTTVENSNQHGLVVDGNATTNSTVTGSFFLNNTYWGIVYVNSAVNLTNNTFGGQWRWRCPCARRRGWKNHKEYLSLGQYHLR